MWPLHEYTVKPQYFRLKGPRKMCELTNGSSKVTENCLYHSKFMTTRAVVICCCDEHYARRVIFHTSLGFFTACMHTDGTVATSRKPRACVSGTTLHPCVKRGCASPCVCFWLAPFPLTSAGRILHRECRSQRVQLSPPIIVN